MVNLHCLEFALRAFLWNHEAPLGATNWSTALMHLQVGENVPVSALSNYDTLGKLVEKFNNIVRPVDPSLTIDPGIVDLRDALAHGRIWASVPEPPMQLVKFNKPQNNLARVTHAELIDDGWLQFQKTRAYEEVEKVQKARQTMQPPK